MLEWKEEAIFLSSQPYGEKGQIASIFTKNHGRYNGWIYCGNSVLKKNLLQKGNYLSANWRARISEQLGRFDFELIKCNAANYIHSPLKLAALNSICSILDKIIPEREPNPNVFEASKALISLLNQTKNDETTWVKGYVNWEMGLISFLGFEIELNKCSVTGLGKNLAYVSPKTGKCVTFDVGFPYHKKLFFLPEFLGGNYWNEENIFFSEMEEGLKLSKFFLKKYFFDLDNKLPFARERLTEIFNKLNGNKNKYENKR